MTKTLNERILDLCHELTKQQDLPNVPMYSSALHKNAESMILELHTLYIESQAKLDKATGVIEQFGSWKERIIESCYDEPCLICGTPFKEVDKLVEQTLKEIE